MVRKFRERYRSLANLKKFVYLISPKKINNNFFDKLEKVLSFRNVKFFQLRLKKYSAKNLVLYSKKIKKITKKHKVNFIINDRADIANKVNADGCHLGQNDGSIIDAKKLLKNKIIGVTCHNSKLLAKIAIKNNADYVAFGSFGNSKLKPKAKKANLKILNWAKLNIKRPIVVIGGINNLNYKKFLKRGAKYIAISSYIWDNPKLKPEIAIKKFR